MTISTTTSVTQYAYDPLDRLTTVATAAKPQTQRFYRKNRLITETQGSRQLHIVHSGSVLLAEREHDGNVTHVRALITDYQGSVLQTKDGRTAYAPYGHRSNSAIETSRLGFNSQLADAMTGHYPLGNGHRFYNPVLMRFNSADKLSPFAEGGINSYAYCGGDPINRKDDNGQMWQSAIWLGVALSEVVGSYIAPTVLRKIPSVSKGVQKIPGISNPNVGKIAKKISWAVGAIGATTFATSSVMEFAHPDSDLFDPLLILMGTAAGIGFSSGIISIMHRVSLPAIKLPKNGPALADAPTVSSSEIRQSAGTPINRRHSL